MGSNDDVIFETIAEHIPLPHLHLQKGGNFSIINAIAQ